MPKQISSSERDRILHSVGIDWHFRDEIGEVLKGTLYPESLRKHLLELEEAHKLTRAHRHAIQEQVFPE